VQLAIVVLKTDKLIILRFILMQPFSVKFSLSVEGKTINVIISLVLILIKEPFQKFFQLIEAAKQPFMLVPKELLMSNDRRDGSVL
jgi:hypothetical protein